MAEYRLEIKQGNSSFCSLRQDLESCSWNTLQVCQLPTVDTGYVQAISRAGRPPERCRKSVVWPQLLRLGNPRPLFHWHEAGRTCATESHFCSSRKSHSGGTAGSWQMLKAYPLPLRLWLWGKSLLKSARSARKWLPSSFLCLLSSFPRHLLLADVMMGICLWTTVMHFFYTECISA